ncbi:MAG: hypothetical protein LBF88_10235 [Planctomycetaceae bacterium]|jgi:hypothetical protein|nr:hypothetical protein [Planctomycetaceae bacterium]
MSIQKLLDWFDNETNPIVVRQIRRLVRSHTMTWTTILFLVISAITISGCLVSIGIRPANDLSIAIWTAAGSGTATFFISIAAFCPAVMYGAARVNDELLDLAFSWHKLLFGYVLLGVLWTGYYAVLALPFVSLAFVFGGDLFPQLLLLFQTIMIGISFNLLFFSFLVKVRSMTGLVLTTIMLFFFRSMPFTILGMVHAIILYGIGIVPAPSGSPPVPASTFTLPSHTTPWFGYYIVFMWFIFGILAFWLCRSHLLHPRRAAWQDIGINLLVYGIFTVLINALWVVLRLTGFT